MKKMFVMLAVATSMVLGSCGGDDAKGGDAAKTEGATKGNEAKVDNAVQGEDSKEGGSMSVCDCVKAEQEYMSEMRSASGDESKMKEVEEKFKNQKEECEKMMKDASEEDQKKMMEEAKNCK